MCIRFGGCLAAAGCSHEESFLYKERLIDLLQRTGFLTYRRSDRRNSNRAPFEFLNNGSQNAVVHFIQAMFIHIQRPQCMLCDPKIDHSIAEYLREIPD